MTQVVVSAAFAAAGTLVGLPPGVGWAIGSMAYASTQTVRNKGPISNDLKAPKLQYGSPIPRIYGRMRVAGSPVWISQKRAIANTTSEGGKGGPKVENTTYTYEVDVLYIVKIEAPLALAITRVWIGGELKYCALADADLETLQASAETEAWEEMTLFDGNPSQLPWSVYEADVETENAIAYRNRTTIGIQSLQLGSSDQIPLVEFEIITAGTQETIASTTLLLAQFNGDATDSSPYNRTPVVDNVTFTSVAQIRDTNSDISNVSWGGLGRDSTKAYTLECLVELIEMSDSRRHIFSWALASPPDGVSVHYYGTTGQIGFRNTVADGGGSVVGEASPPLSGNQFTHVALVVPAGPNPNCRLYLNGQNLVSGVVASVGDVGAGDVYVGTTASQSSIVYPARSFDVDAIRVSEGELYTVDFDPPTSLGSDLPFDVWTPDSVDLADIVQAECQLAGLTQIDVTDISGIEVTGFAATGSARQVIEQLMAGYYFEACCSDKLYFRRRGRSVAATIAYDDLAAGQDQASDTIFDPVRGNLEELPAQVACGFMNISADYEAGSEMGDRLIGPGKQVQRADLPLVLTPAEGKGRALAMVLDALAAGTSAKISLSDDYAELEPTDAIVVPDREDTTRRMRIVRESYQQGVKSFDLVGDDPSALVTTGLTMDEGSPAISVRPPFETEMLLIDGPLFRDSENVPGPMVAARGDAGWPGAQIRRSLDGFSFDTVAATIVESANLGTTIDALGDWDEFYYDETNTFDAVMSDTVSSSTREAMQIDRGINLLLVGAHGRWEAIRFVTATLLSPGTYRFSELLRGLYGTEWARDTHQAGDQVVVIRTAGLRKIEQGISDIGLERYYKGVTLGRNIGTAETEAFTDSGVNLKPWSPTYLQGTRDSAGDIEISWLRRTRLQVRYGGPGGTVAPLGEATELYEVDIIDGSAGAIRTLTTTSESVVYSVEDQIADFGSPQGSVSVAVYQISAIVGRGYALEGSV